MRHLIFNFVCLLRTLGLIHIVLIINSKRIMANITTATYIKKLVKIIYEK